MWARQVVQCCVANEGNRAFGCYGSSLLSDGWKGELRRIMTSKIQRIAVNAIVMSIRFGLSYEARLSRKVFCHGCFSSIEVGQLVQTPEQKREIARPVAGDGDGEVSEASEREYREREEQIAFLREEEERLGAFSRSLVIFHLSFIFPSS